MQYIIVIPFFDIIMEITHFMKKCSSFIAYNFKKQIWQDLNNIIIQEIDIFEEYVDYIELHYLVDLCVVSIIAWYHNLK